MADMNEGRTEFLSLKITPARLNPMQVAWLLGFELHEIPILVATGCLKPLGHPARNAVKFFSTETVMQLCRDERWLAKASDAIGAYRRIRNARKQSALGRPKNLHRSVNRADPPLGTTPVRL